MPRGSWLKNLPPEQRKERAAKMRAAKVAKLALHQALGEPERQEIAPQPVVIALAAEMRYLQAWKSFLNEYLTALSGINGLGIPNVIDYCRMCAGNGIHIIGCGCVCHRARKSLQEYANEFGPRIESI